MQKVLIAESDMTLQPTFRLELKESEGMDSLELLFASDGKEAIDILKANDIAVLVTDINLPGIDGFSLLAYINKHHPSTACIVISSSPISSLRKRRLEDIVFCFIRKPISAERLATKIVQAMLGTSLGGNLSGVSLPSFIQMIEIEQKTCRLAINTPNDDIKGTLLFYDGVLFDAEFETLTGEEAALEMLIVDEPKITILGVPEKKKERRINSTFMQLSLEAMKRKDEEEHNDEKETWTLRSRIRKLMAEGIELAEGMQFKEAYRVFNELLILKPDHAQGWLWLSRCFGNLEKIRSSFYKAYHYDPQNPEILLEEKKITATETTLSKSKVRRCPFCWAPNNPDSLSCHFCSAYFILRRETIPQMGKADPVQMKKALQRYERVFLRGADNRALFYGGLAYLNLNNLDSALDFFKKLEANSPQGNPYEKQVQSLLDFVSANQAENETIVKVHRTNEIPRDSSKKNVLVVEDSPTTRKVIAMVLKKNGFHVTEAADGVEALGKLNELRPDLILLDVILPKLDGYEILSIIRKKEEFKEIPVIMLTSKNSMANKIKGKFSSVNAYLTKPFKPEELMREISRHINGGVVK